MATVGSDLIASTNAGLERLRSVVAKLGDSDLRALLPGGWTASAVLAHLAFWDRWVETRWMLFERNSAFDDLPDSIADLVNAAALPTWLAISPREAVDLCLAASASVKSRIATLPPAAIAAAIATNRPTMLDRARH